MPHDCVACKDYFCETRNFFALHSLRGVQSLAHEAPPIPCGTRKNRRPIRGRNWDRLFDRDAVAYWREFAQVEHSYRDRTGYGGPG